MNDFVDVHIAIHKNDFHTFCHVLKFFSFMKMVAHGKARHCILEYDNIQDGSVSIEISMGIILLVIFLVEFVEPSLHVLQPNSV